MSVQPVDKTLPAAPSPTADPPPLNAGDHLSRPEFERRYTAHPEIKKAELIEIAAVLVTLQAGLQSAEHVDFLARLQAED